MSYKNKEKRDMIGSYIQKKGNEITFTSFFINKFYILQHKK